MDTVNEPRAAGHAPYRAYLTAVGAQPLFLDILEQQLAGWLLEKRINAEVRGNARWADSSREYEVHHVRRKDLRYLQATLVEHDKNNGDWTTELLASSEGWVDLKVANARNNWVAVPRLAKYLMQVLELGDGALAYVDDVREVDVPGVDALMKALTDEDRHGPIFVAGSALDANGDLLAAYAQQMPRWAKQTYGLAGFIRLTPDATSRFAELATTHAVAPWTIRTFYPSPAIGDSVDARRHRYLTTRSLAEMPTNGVATLLGNIARTQAMRRGDLPQVTRVRRAMERFQHEQLIAELQEELPLVLTTPEEVVARESEVLTGTAASAEAEPGTTETAEETATVPAVVEAAEDYLRLVALLRDVLGVDQPTEESLRRLADQLGRHSVSQTALERVTAELQSQNDRIDDLLDEQREFNRLLEDDQLAIAEQQEDLDSKEAEIRWLRKELAAKGEYEIAHAAPPAEELEAPDSFVELLDRLPTIAAGRVVFTGNGDAAIALADHDTLQAAVRGAWECVLVLADYLRARDEGLHEAGVTQYLDKTPDGCRRMSPKRHAPTETAATMKRFGKDRVFPVPTSVSTAGEMEMVSHFKLARIGMVSPRLYYLDNYTSDRSVYIGYIGPHLRNTQTN